MFIRKGLLSTSGRAVALATVAAFALTAFEVPKVQAAEVKTAPVAKVADQGDITDFSARRRHYGGAAAGLAAFGLVAGTIAAAAASSRYRDDYYYGGAPAYYGGSAYGGPAYYDAPAYYGYSEAPAYYAPSYGYSGRSNSNSYRRQFGGN